MFYTSMMLHGLYKAGQINYEYVYWKTNLKRLGK